ncbi:hypothetical protein WR25_00809 [Diploscapter pachys]|uniref:Domain of unknown function DB domain-containing protein n=1 Tax=Diploscapter pachys TaxID=2018661 RepID=A0A2A2JKW0_9BILA|nr:hypothetical protein WR25_00809 [Diploscapter pachys]
MSSGACGCCCKARAKARGVSIGKINGDKPIEVSDKEGEIFGLKIWNDTKIYANSTSFGKLTNPNFLFHRCCEERKLPSACIQKCHFNVYDRETLESMFIGNDACSIEYLPEMQFCAAQGMDHSQCCKSKGVAKTTAGEKCLVFCDQRPDIYTPIDYSYAPCFDSFDTIKRCFYEEIHQKAEKHFGKKTKKQLL